MKQEVLFYDSKTDIEAGINADGDLYIGSGASGQTLRDTPANRRRVERDIARYTEKTVTLQPKE